MPKSTVAGDRVTVIEAIATAIPRFTVPQNDAAEFMQRIEGLSEPLRKRIPQVYERSGIDRRHTCLEDYARHPDLFEFFPRNAALTPSPTTGDRNRIYRQESIPLALQAARACLNDAAVVPADVTHVIVVSCTGFFAPGLDIHLVKELGLPGSTERTVIGFMGCYAAFNGLRSANNICASDPDATVLLVCVELCTLHFQIEDTLESVIVNALFSDGCAACLVRSSKLSESAGKLIYRAGAAYLDNNSLDAMSWAIGDAGFIMGLSPKVPEYIAASLPNFCATFTGNCGITLDDLDFWAVHPGGRQVLDRTAKTLNLDTEALADSYAVLRENGNMSSPTILFILQRIMRRQKEENYRLGLGLAFGPGLTIEGCLLEFGSSAGG